MVGYFHSKKYPGLVVCFDYQPDEVQVTSVTTKDDNVELVDYFQDLNFFENLEIEAAQWGWDYWKHPDYERDAA